jgi:hypothetical protein
VPPSQVVLPNLMQATDKGGMDYKSRICKSREGQNKKDRNEEIENNKERDNRQGQTITVAQGEFFSS